jgi:hypothetical protein
VAGRGENITIEEEGSKYRNIHIKHRNAQNVRIKTEMIESETFN